MAFSREAFIEQAKIENRSQAFVDISVNYIDNLQKNNFPVLFSIPHLAMEIGMESGYINYLIWSRENQYIFFLLQKKNKEAAPREIMAPKEQLKYIQRWININILQKAKFNDYIKGFVPGSSILQNAKVHSGAKYILKIDLLKFFDCIDQKKVYGIFRMFGYVKNLAWDFAKLCTAEHRYSYWQSFNEDDFSILKEYISGNPAVLPQGAPTSPLIANLVASRLDKRLGQLALKRGVKYSRYADDLCFSSNLRGQIPSISFLSKIIEEEGFFINREKVKFLKRGGKQYVTGLSVTNGVSVEKKKRRQVFTHLYFANKYGIKSHLSKLKKAGFKKDNYQNWLLGNISYQYSINNEVGTKMFELFNKINWTI